MSEIGRFDQPRHSRQASVDEASRKSHVAARGPDEDQARRCLRLAPRAWSAPCGLASENVGLILVVGSDWTSMGLARNGAWGSSTVSLAADRGKLAPAPKTHPHRSAPRRG